MSFQWDMSVVSSSIPVILKGVVVAFELWVICFAIGMIIGSLLGIARSSKNKMLNLLAICYVEVFRNTPVLIQVIWFYYALPILTGQQLGGFEAALLGLALNTSAYCTEVFRSGILSIPKGQFEGGASIGMRSSQVFRRIILPQVIKRMLPAFTNRGIELAKMTSLCSVIAVEEIMYQGRLLSAAYFRPLEIFTVVAIVYFIAIFPGSWCSARLEKRYAKYD
ncbi:amino acid ABC transporter permease [Rhodanobacter aciditrophus]|uniref:Amino acid ABC transporter permease n=1 Tax=Rhodanobacter aciditrophus TaxID=1623218 RepID=A0ABW4B208_9GAMM